jgi:3-methyl-2-oxobutanoate hydroxymethyltransferase
MQKKITTIEFAEMKKRNEKITMLTAYDYPVAKALDNAGIDSLLVGDTLGMVVYGYDSTLPVTVEDMVRHTQAVARGAKRALVVTDLPFMSFGTPEDALKNAGTIMKFGNADAVKIEGGREREKAVKLMIEAGIPVMGHIGLTPQYMHQFGGFKVQGKSAEAANRLVEDALILQEAGAFSIVLETIPWKIAKEITAKLRIPTIGIGAGVHCDGQVLVSMDMMGFLDTSNFKFLKKYANVYETMMQSGKAYIDDVKKGEYPTTSHSYDISDEEYNAFMEKLKKKN